MINQAALDALREATAGVDLAITSEFNAACLAYPPGTRVVAQGVGPGSVVAVERGNYGSDYRAIVRIRPDNNRRSLTAPLWTISMETIQ